jgi:hypothetical protein
MTSNLGSSRWAHCRYTLIRSARQRRLSLSSPLVFQRAVAILWYSRGLSLYPRSSRIAAPLLALSLLTFWLSAKFDTFIADHTKFWRVASPVQVGADGGRKFDVKDASWASEMMSDRRRLLLKAKSLPVCPFPTIGFSDAGITPCRPTGSLFLCTCPCSRRAAGSRVVRTTGGWCAQESCHGLGEARKCAGLGSLKSAPCRQIGLVRRLRLIF